MSSRELFTRTAAYAADFLESLGTRPVEATAGADELRAALGGPRHHVLHEVGWDVGRDGLSGAPRVRVLAGAQRHVTVDRALRLLGLGTGAIESIPADDQGRMLAEPLRRALAAGGGPTIVCAQLGNVNTGAFGPLPQIADAADEAGTWLHVDGAFG